jgi:hypothetical protein
LKKRRRRSKVWGLAAWWLNLAEVVFDSRERAFRAYRQRGDQKSAARIAVWLAWDSAAFRGEEGVAKGWLQRASRLLDGQPDSPEHAFLAARAAVFALLDDGDPEAADTLALEAIPRRPGHRRDRLRDGGTRAARLRARHHRAHPRRPARDR